MRSWGVATHCCENMRLHSELDCDVHDDPVECADCLVLYYSGSREYGIPVRDGGSSYVVIQYCPWCGTNLGSNPSQKGRRKIPT